MSIQDNADTMTQTESSERPQDQEVSDLASSDKGKAPVQQEQEVPDSARYKEDRLPAGAFSTPSNYIPSPEEQLPDDVRLRLSFFNSGFASKAHELIVYTPDGEDELFMVVQEIIEYTQNPKIGKHYRYSFDDTGIGRLFADSYKWKLRYVPEWKEWVIYTGKIWTPCGLEIMEYCKDFTDKVRDIIDCYHIPDDSIGKQIKSIVKKWQSRKGKEMILKEAASVHPVSINDFDKDPFIFNCQNFTLNLKTPEPKKHNPRDFLMKIANVEYDPNAECPRWDRHMMEVFDEDADLVEYTQKALGYALTGDTRYECFFILYGQSSRNGKGVTMGTFQHMLGDYACTTSPDTITQKKFASSGGPSEDIARLKGARFVNISEPDQNMVLSSALIKTLTGNDTIIARMLYKNSIEFKPICKFFINTNHRPKVTDRTVFLSKRIKVIPFDHHFPDDKQDTGLKDELIQKENLSGILNWCIEGLRYLSKKDFSKEAFAEPEAVKRAIDDYEQAFFGKSATQQDNDDITQFIAEVLEQNSGSEIRAMSAYGRYCEWCEEKDCEVYSQKMFSQKMGTHVTIRRKRPSGRSDANPVSMIIGYKFKSEG